MAFHVGQKVVCVDDTLLPGEPGPFVHKGQVYTIDKISTASYGGDDFTVFHFCEVVESNLGLWHSGFLPENFRPLIEKKTDTGMATLREILDRETIQPPQRAKHRVTDDR